MTVHPLDGPHAYYPPNWYGGPGVTPYPPTGGGGGVYPLQQATWGEEITRSYFVNLHVKFSNRAGNVHEHLVSDMLPALDDLGIRGIRDRFLSPGNGAWPNQRAIFPLLGEAGMRLHLTVGTAEGGTVDDMTRTDLVPSLVSEMQNHYGADAPFLFMSFGGVNEPNAAGVTNWQQKVVDHQRRMWQGFKPAYPNVIICGPSHHDHAGTEAQRRQNYIDLANVVSGGQTGIRHWVDFGDFHHYPAGTTSGQLDQRIDWARGAYPTPMGLFCTEGGYNTGVGITTNGNPVPEDIAAQYAIRYLMEARDRGVVRFMRYETADDVDAGAPSIWEAHFGAYIRTPAADPSTWELKPEFYTTQRFLARLGEPAGWDAATHTPQPLSMQVDTNASNVKWHLAHRADGKWVVMVWRDVKNYNYDKSTGTGSYINQGTVAVTLNLGQSWPCAVYRPDQQAAAIQTANTNSLNLSLDGRMLMVEVG